MYVYFDSGGAGNSYHLKTLSAGATFGEIALIRDMKREFTAVCKGNELRYGFSHN